MTSRAFEGIEGEMSTIRDRWLHFFDSLILGHNIYTCEDFGNVIDTITDL